MEAMHKWPEIPIASVDSWGGVKHWQGRPVKTARKDMTKPEGLTGRKRRLYLILPIIINIILSQVIRVERGFMGYLKSHGSATAQVACRENSLQIRNPGKKKRYVVNAWKTNHGNQDNFRKTQQEHWRQGKSKEPSSWEDSAEETWRRRKHQKIQS